MTNVVGMALQAVNNVVGMVPRALPSATVGMPLRGEGSKAVRVERNG